MRLKIIFTFIFLIANAIWISAQTDSNYVKVEGYYHSDGTYVQPHYKIIPDIGTTSVLSNLEKINPYADQKRHSRSSVNPLIDTNNQVDVTKENVKICTNSQCKEKRLIYNSGYMYKSSIYCVIHTPQCSIHNCKEPRLLNYLGPQFLDFCKEHAHTCKITNCYNMSRIDDSGHRVEQTEYCELHTPKCGSPSCSNFSKVNYFGSGYQKYCENHRYTCKVDDCYRIARIDTSIKRGEQTNYCDLHTPECANPSCSNFAQVNYFGSGYQKYCRGHKYTCKVDNCYISARVDDSGYKSEQTSYCNVHTPKCSTPSCNNHAQVSYFGSGYQKYCATHKNTCKVDGCYNIARIDSLGAKKLQTPYCLEHTPMCNHQSCDEYSKIRSYGSAYMKYCGVHVE